VSWKAIPDTRPRDSETSVTEYVVCAWNNTRSVGRRAQVTSRPFRDQMYVVRQVRRCILLHTHRLGRVSREYSLLINVDKTKVMASDGITCRILIQNELLEQVDTFPYLGSLSTEDCECMTEFRTRLNRGQVIGASLQKIWKCHSIPISTKIRLMKAIVCSVYVAIYGCESWTLRKNKETCLK